jgi:glycerol-3-phosphate dehydrogenase subunit B
VTHLLVVGQGLAGLFAANLALRKGLRVTLISQGRGGLSLSAGCLDLGQPAASLPSQHPYRSAGLQNLPAAVDAFRELLLPEGIEFLGNPDVSTTLPTAAGRLRHTHLVPRSMARGHFDAEARMVIAGFDGFRDFDAGLVADGIRRAGWPAQSISLPLPGEARRDLYSTDLARRFERDWTPEQLSSLWGPRLGKTTLLGLPAVLGLDHAPETHLALERSLGVGIFEIPTLPPSVPGLRLERALRRRSLQGGGRLIEGPAVVGRVDGRSGGGRVLGVVAATSAGPRAFQTDAVILATGGFLNGGLRADRAGRVADSVFDLPVEAATDRGEWLGDGCLGYHPYDLFGLRVNEHMQPTDRQGRAFFDNLFACGGVLGGADRRGEKSRQGIDLVTAYAAVQSVAV